MTSPESVVRDLLPVLREMCLGEYGIALGGSHAKGRSDAHSDVDVYLFAERVLPAEKRRERVVRALGEATAAFSWGADEPFVQGGTDFRHGGIPVECWLRNAREVERTLEACRAGEIRREYAVWAVMGFFDHVVLADVQGMRIVEDPHGMLARWKEAVRTYPEPLRRAILRRFMAEAAFWPENFHYASAVERGDLLYVSGIVQQVVHALVQVLFALNREYFPGEKGLAPVLERLPITPPDFASRLQSVLCAGSTPVVAELREQRRELGGLVAEVQRLVAADGGAR